ncbi:arylacetamide deacetylase-like 2 [Peromyscus leucopus]|uniref:arylacetamide deacetylase-like 2 n=1 Tax=Peromyscus leucopus TaxID=10041 RepID=UPI001884F388|nr:arylacetamide deacetylase-like 2 [Peromyscus leucopus]
MWGCLGIVPIGPHLSFRLASSERRPGSALEDSHKEAKNFRVQEAGKKNNTLKTILENLLLKMAFSRIADIQDKNRWLQNDPEFKDRIKAQALIYPGLQSLDTFLPSHREYEYGPILSREMTIKLACLYVSEDKALLQAALRNEHMPEGSRHLFKFVNWSDLLPEKYKKNHVYTEPVLGKLNDSYPALMDSRASPLLVNDSQLQSLPLTYILTCEHDLIRDDSLIYITRLRNVGVRVTHDHIEEGIHGALSFTRAPVFLHLGLRIRDKYISWLEENL